MLQTFAMKARLAVCLGVLIFCGNASAGQQAANLHPALAAPSQGIFLVFPFENDGASPRLDWLSEGLEELTIERLSAVGQHVYTHEARATELDRNGLPPRSPISHATMLRIAAELDADFLGFR